MWSYLCKRAKSFHHAGAGILRLVREERNAQIHLLATVVVAMAGAWMHLSVVEWCLVILAIVLVWAAEAMNSAIERVCDVVSREQHPMIGAAKDLAASAVLIVAIGALLVGVLLVSTHLPR